VSNDLWSRVDPRDAEIAHNLMAEHPVKVGALASALGIDVVRAAMEPKISGLIKPSATAPSGFEIRVNKYETRERQRFTVAHELAHYLLHRQDIGAGVVDSVLYRSSLTSRKETEANRLAAAIVMPYESVRRELLALGGIETPGAAERLAATFGVSLPAMKVRLGIA
jgi:predicted transcriptional regulator